MGKFLDSNQFAEIRKNLKESVQKETPKEPLKPFKEHVEPERKKDLDPSHITRDGISSMYESIKSVKENHPQDPTLIFGQDLNEQSTDHYASAIRDHSEHIQKQKPVNEAGLFDGDPMDAPVSKKDFFKILNTSLSSLGGGGVGLDEVRHYVDDKIQNAFDVDFGNTFVNVTGDSMSGQLVINSGGLSVTSGGLSVTGGSIVSSTGNSTTYPFDLKTTNDQTDASATVRFQSNLKVKKNNEAINGSNLLDVQRENDALVLDGTIQTKKLEHFSGTNSLIELRSGIYQNVSHKFTGSNYNSMMHRTFFQGIPYIDYSIGGLDAEMDKDADHPHVWFRWRNAVQHVESKTIGSYRYNLREVYDELEHGETGGLQYIRWVRDPVTHHDAVNYKTLNSRSSRLQPSYIGDSVQRAIIQSGFSTPLDSFDSSGGVGTMFVNTSGATPRLQFWKDSQWLDLRSKFDSGEVLGIVNSLRYTTANHDSDTLAQVDSAYVQARVAFPADTIIDSNDVIGIVDSAYVQARQITYDFLDSAEAINLVDSAYVQARVTFPADQVGIDSATSISLTQSTVDSAYVQTRIDASQLDFSGVPTSDPLTAGLVWRDSDNGNVLKVSVG